MSTATLTDHQLSELSLCECHLCEEIRAETNIYKILREAYTQTLSNYSQSYTEN